MLQLLTVLQQNLSNTNCMSMRFTLVMETNQTAQSDDLPFRKQGRSVKMFFLLIF